MQEQATIILTSHDPALIALVEEALAGVRVLVIDGEPPQEPLPGRVWCFVDWLLPSVSGLEVCRRLREAPATAASHITMVLDDDDSEMRRRALRGGADDYLPGPLTGETILDRLRQYRRGQSAVPAHRRLRNGDISLDLASYQMRYRRKIVPLRPNEFRLLVHFLEHPDQLFTRQQLITMLGKDAGTIDERTVDVWIGRLRRALKTHGVPEQLRTVRSMGYVLDSADSGEDAFAA